MANITAKDLESSYTGWIQAAQHPVLWMSAEAVRQSFDRIHAK